jgi:hypothetical protein
MAVDAASLVRAVPALFGGLFLGVALVAAGAGRRNPSHVLRLGGTAQAAGLVLVAVSWSPTVVVGAAGVAGLGFGIAEASGAALARDVGGNGVGHALLGLTAATAATAALTPLAVVFGGTTFVREVLAAAAVPHLLAALALPWRKVPRDASRSPEQAVKGSRRVWWIAVALFCYVGSETIVSGWSAVLPRELLALTPAHAAAGTSLFWLLLMVGRIASSLAISRGADALTVLTACQIGAGVALAGSAATAHTDAAVSVALYAASAAFLGPCYALLLGQALQGVTADYAGRLSACLIAAGALGGTAWSAGAGGATHHGQGVVATAACVAVVMSALAAQARRTT